MKEKISEILKAIGNLYKHFLVECIPSVIEIVFGRSFSILDVNCLFVIRIDL
jgi:hypothetical protein